jgi:hypothetical protein
VGHEHCPDLAEHDAAHGKLAAWPRLEHESNLHAGVDHCLHAERPQRLDHFRCYRRVCHQLVTDALNQAFQQIQIGVIRHHDAELLHDPVARMIRDRLQVSERHGMQLTVQVPQLYRAQREALHRSPNAAALDVLSDTERVIEQKEHAGQNVSHQCLGAEADGDAYHAGPGEQRSDLQPHGGERAQRCHHQDDEQGEVAQDRQQSPQPGLSPQLVVVQCVDRWRVGRQSRIDQHAHDLP